MRLAGPARADPGVIAAAPWPHLSVRIGGLVGRHYGVLAWASIMDKGASGIRRSFLVPLAGARFVDIASGSVRKGLSGRGNGN